MVDFFLQGFALVEQFLPQDARLDAHVQDMPFEPQFGRQVGGPVAHDGAPGIGQFSLGYLGRYMGAVSYTQLTLPTTPYV